MAEVSCTEREEVMTLIDAFVVTLAESDLGVRVVINDRVTSFLRPADKELAESFNIPPTKLTFKFLQSLPVGSYIASNIWIGPKTMAFAEPVAPLESRKDQWKRIVAAGTAQRTCHVFRSEEAFDHWIKAVFKQMGHS